MVKEDCFAKPLYHSFVVFTGSIVVDVQVSHSSRVSPREAYDYFIATLFGSQNITRGLRINQDIMPSFVLEGQSDQDNETAIIVSVVIVIFALLLTIMLIIFFINRRRSKRYQITQENERDIQIQNTLHESFDNTAISREEIVDRPSTPWA